MQNMRRELLMASAVVVALLAVAAGTLVPAPGPTTATGTTTITWPDMAGEVGSHSSLALDGSGNPVVSYHDISNDDLKVLHCNDPNCDGSDDSITSPDTVGTVGRYTSMALDELGYPVIAYYDVSNLDLKVLHCNDTNCSGNDESVTSPDTDGWVGQYASLVLDDSGNPVISYYDLTNRDLKVLHCNDANCSGGDESVTSPDTDGYVGPYTSLVLDASGNPVVSYYDGTNAKLRVLHCNDPNCSGGDESITAPDGADNVGVSTSLVLDASGNPVVSFLDAYHGELRIMHCTDANCGGRSLISPDTGPIGHGAYSSLALDVSGYPVVSYEGSGNLKVMHCNDANCTGWDESIVSPDTLGDTGQYTSLALDASGNPVVSYYDGTNDDLRLLHCGEPNCNGKVISPTPIPPTATRTPTPTRTPLATATPKPLYGGSLTGVYDVMVHGGAKTIIPYHCIARLDHDAGTDEVKAAAQCYAGLDIDDPNSALPCIPGEGADEDCDGTLELDGPPPPPPYATAVPAEFNGTYDPGTDHLALAGCFADAGGVLGPNMVGVIDVPNAGAQLAANGKQTGQLLLYGNQSIAQCDAKTPDSHGAPEPDPLPVNLHRVGDGNPVPWRTPGDTDWDDDGCADGEELAKAGQFRCGDDPFNPHDGPLYVADMGGIYSVGVAVLRADWDKVEDALIPGFYFTCLSDIQQEGSGTADGSVTARVFCYLDSPDVPVNPEAGGPCFADPADCGDGLPGAAPPGPYADVDDKHTELVGQIDSVNNMLDLEGCFEDRDGAGALGHVYARTVGLDVHTGQGEIELWMAADGTDCANGVGFTPGSGSTAPLAMTRQVRSDEADYYDGDGDGCPDRYELSDNDQQGGLRDPFNRWDFFNPTWDGSNRVDDILAVVNQYFIDKGDPDYTKRTDRTTLTGANPWNLGPPNGQQRVDDILHIVKSYFVDCDFGLFVDPDVPPKPTLTPTPTG